MDKTIETIPEETMQAVVRHRWPGNIRELQNYIAPGVTLSGRVEAEDVEELRRLLALEIAGEQMVLDLTD